jgi:imidazolonepropionase-like amidohydrolase
LTSIGKRNNNSCCRARKRKSNRRSLAALKPAAEYRQNDYKTAVGIKFALGENPKSVYHEKNQAPSTRMATAAIIREHLFKAKDYKNAVQNVQEDEDLDKPDI